MDFYKCQKIIFSEPKTLEQIIDESNDGYFQLLETFHSHELKIIPKHQLEYLLKHNEGIPPEEFSNLKYRVVTFINDEGY